jgi:hypothetical protein
LVICFRRSELTGACTDASPAFKTQIGTTQNDVPFSSLGRDTVYKAGLKIRPGEA